MKNIWVTLIWGNVLHSVFLIFTKVKLFLSKGPNLKKVTGSTFYNMTVHDCC